MLNHKLNPNNWIKLYSDYLFNYTITRVNDREIAQDLISDTFLSGLKSKMEFKGQACERTWLISILKRKIIDHYRKINSIKGKAEVRMSYFDDNESDKSWIEERVADSSSQTAEDKIENSELKDAIYNCINKLPQKQARIFKMKTIIGYDTETICNELNITSSNVWVQVHRARVSLSRCLKKHWFKT